VFVLRPQVYRGTWTNIDVGAKEYRLDSLDMEPAAAGAAGGQPSEAAVQRAKVGAGVFSSKQVHLISAMYSYFSHSLVQCVICSCRL
jgi:hypothetical protein